LSAARPELVAAAADWPALEAALQAGADAVEVRLKVLNGRSAGGLPHEDLSRAVELAHQRGARLYLGLRVDLGPRQLGQAARVLELARQQGVDAVVVRDPAVLLLREAFPELPFHLSVAGGLTNSADVAAAADLGVSRAELFCGLTPAEIKAAVAQPGVAAAVSVSADFAGPLALRPPIANWMSGRVDDRQNADAAAPPGRVPRWADMAINAATEKRPAAASLAALSSSDATAVSGLARACAKGVEALVIDQSLAAAALGETLALCRRALTGEEQTHPEPEQTLFESEHPPSEQDHSEPDRVGPEDRGDTPRLGDPESTRDSIDHTNQAADSGDAESEELPAEAAAPMYDFTIDVTPQGIECRCQCEDRRQEWRIPKTVVRRAHKAVPIGHLMESLEGQLIQGYQLGLGTTNDPEFLLVPRAVAGLIDRIAAIIRQARRSPDRPVRVALPEAVQELLAPEPPSPVNTRHLGHRPNRARLDYRGLSDFLRQVQPESVVVP